MSIVALSIDALLPAFAFITEELKVADPNHTQLTISFLFLGLAIGQLVCGPLSDAFGRKPILFISLTTYLLGTLLCFFASSIESLLMGRFIQGLGVAGPNVAATSLVRDRYKGRQMARVMSLVMMIFIMVPTIAPALGEGILFIAEWRGIFIMYIAYALGITFWIAFRLEESLSVDRRTPFKLQYFKNAFAEVFKTRQTFLAMLASGLVFGWLIGYINSCLQIIQIQFETGRLFSLYFGLGALMIGASSMINSLIVERYGMYFITLRSLAVISLSSCLFLGIQSLITIEFWMFLLYGGVLFSCFGFIFGNMNAIAMEPMGHIAGIAAGVIGFCSSLMSITLGTAIGQAYDGTVYPITLGACVLCSLAWILLHRSKSRSI